jgi:hypothetical protein
MELDRVLRVIFGMDHDDVDDVSLMVVRLDELMIPEEVAQAMLPEPNCDDPTCWACMELRRLRGETIESNPGHVRTGLRPSDGPPIII